MGYHEIRYNQQGKPYIVEKNFGHVSDNDESRSHWTWHITARGIKHLTTGSFGKSQPMPRYINEDQLSELRRYGMLQRNDGSIVGRNTLYPSDDAKERSTQAAQPPKSSRKPTVKRIKRPIHTAKQPNETAPRKPKQPERPGRQRGIWGWLKSLLGLE